MKSKNFLNITILALFSFFINFYSANIGVMTIDTFGFFDNNNFKNQSEFLEALNNWGFKTSEHNQVVKNISELIKFHEKFENERYNLDYDVDGLVYKINNLDLQKRLGFTSNSPRWAIAHKFSADSANSEILNIDIQVGSTGALTPVAKV